MLLGRHFTSLLHFVATVSNSIESGEHNQLVNVIADGETEGYQLCNLAVGLVGDVLEIVQALPADHYSYFKTLLDSGLQLNQEQIMQVFCFGVVVNDVNILIEMYRLPAAARMDWTDFTTSPYILCRSLHIAEHLYTVGCPFTTSLPMINWVIHGQSEIVRRFLSIAPVEPPWPGRKSLLEFAVEAGYSETVKVLLESGRYSVLQRAANGQRLESVIGVVDRQAVTAILYQYRVVHAWTAVVRHFCPLLIVLAELKDPFITHIIPFLLELL